MNEEKSKLNLYLRLVMRIIASVGFGILTCIICLWIFVFWCIIFFPSVSLQSPAFILIFINIAGFLGAYLGGYLSLTFKRSIITVTCIATILGILFIIIGGALQGVINIITITLGGLLGGGLLNYVKKKPALVSENEEI